MEIELLHGDYLGVDTVGDTAFDAESGALRGLAYAGEGWVGGGGTNGLCRVCVCGVISRSKVL